jgi:acetyl-CoA carboxylase biotin carboxylase subunit
MDTPDFRKGMYNTHFIEKNGEFLLVKRTCDRNCEDIALIATYAQYISRIEESKKLNAAPSEKKETNWKRQLRKFTSRI